MTDRESITLRELYFLDLIFICSCCKRRHYEKSVTEITKHICDKINSKHPGLYKKCIPEGTIVRYLANGTYKAGIYICSTCKNTMMSGKIPSMAEVNGLQLVKIPEDYYLTELENNLIALNINFQFI